MKQDILNLILRAEDEYREKLGASIIEAEQYVDESKKKQIDNFERLKYEWYLFEKREKEKFEKLLIETEQKMEAETQIKKDGLSARRRDRIGPVADRLKKEVLSLIWR